MADKKEVTISSEIAKALELRSPKCFVCGMILRDFRENGRLTDGPKDWANVGTWPVDGKLKHLALEGLTEHSVSQ